MFLHLADFVLKLTLESPVEYGCFRFLPRVVVSSTPRRFADVKPGVFCRRRCFQHGHGQCFSQSFRLKQNNNHLPFPLRLELSACVERGLVSAGIYMHLTVMLVSVLGSVSFLICRLA